MGVGWEYGSREFLEHPMFSVEVPPGPVAITGIKLKFMTINAGGGITRSSLLS